MLVRRTGAAVTAACIVSLGLISLALSVWALDNDPDAAFYLPQYRIWELALGAVLAIAISEGWLDRLLRAPLAMAALAYVGLALIIWPVVSYDEETAFPGIAALPPCLGAAALIASGSYIRTPVARLLRLAPFVFIGKISYSLYLWHWPVISLYFYVNVDDLALGQSLVCIVLSFVLAIASWRYIERPFRQRTQISRGKIFMGFVASTALIIGAANIVTKFNGFPDRMPEDVASVLAPDGLLHDRRDCHRVDPLRARNGDVCIRGDLSAPPSIMLAGDSHADAISPAFFEAAGRAGLSGYHYTAPGFLPLVGVTRPGKPDWLAQTDAMIAFLKKRPEIKTIYITRLWLVQMTGQSYRHEGRIWQDAAYDGSGTAYNPKATIRGLTALANIFPDRRFVLFDDIPVGNELDLRTHARLLLYGDKTHLSNLGLPATEEREQRARYEPLLQNLAATLPNVGYQSIFTSLCGPDICPLYDGTTRLYRNGDHLSSDGALSLTGIVYDSFFSTTSN